MNGILHRFKLPLTAAQLRVVNREWRKHHSNGATMVGIEPITTFRTKRKQSYAYIAILAPYAVRVIEATLQEPPKTPCE